MGKHGYIEQICHVALRLLVNRLECIEGLWHENRVTDKEDGRGVFA